MADSFADVDLPIVGNYFELKINYQINLNIKDKKKLTLPFKFFIVENSLGSQQPKMSQIIADLEKFILRRLLPLLGKNVQLTSMTLKINNLIFIIPLYKFGTSEKHAVSPDTALFFLLQPYGKPLSYRLYVKGCSSFFSQKPLSNDALTLIHEFETLFTSKLGFLDGALIVKQVRGSEELISASFRELKQFAPRKPMTRKLLSKLKRKPKSKKISIMSYA